MKWREIFLAISDMFFCQFLAIFANPNLVTLCEGGIQSPPDNSAVIAPLTPPTILVQNDVIKSESHDNIFSAPKSISDLKRRASDVALSTLATSGSSSSLNNRPSTLNLNYRYVLTSISVIMEPITTIINPDL